MSDHGVQRSVTKIKLGGAARTHQSIQVERTLEETWLYAPEGTPVHYESGELYTCHSSAGVQLLVPGEWWTAWWFQDKRWIAIDVTLPVIELDGGFSYTDLELDLWWRDGDCGIVDQDDLRNALDKGLVDRATASQAEQVAAGLLERLRRDRTFIDRGFEILDRSHTGLSQPQGIDGL